MSDLPQSSALSSLRGTAIRPSMQTSGSSSFVPQHGQQEMHEKSLEAIAGMQEASASLTELVKTVEKYGLIMGEVQKLCHRLGLRCESNNMEMTFQRIFSLFVEYQKMAEGERIQRNETLAHSQQLRKKLEQSERDKSQFESMIHQQHEQILQQTELIKKLEMGFRQAQQQMHDFEQRFTQELHEERQSRAALQKAYEGAESKTVQLEQALKEAELACQDAVAALDQQRLVCGGSEHDKIDQKQQTAQLEQERREPEAKYEALLKSSDPQVSAALPSEKGSDETTPVECSQPPDLAPGRVQNATTGQSAAAAAQQEITVAMNGPSSTCLAELPEMGDSSTVKQQGSMSRTLVVPQSARSSGPIHTFDLARGQAHSEISPCNDAATSNAGGHPPIHSRVVHLVPRTEEFRVKTTFPQSVVSGPVILGNSKRQKDSKRSCFGGWSPCASDRVIQSESSDSVVVDDHILDGFNQSNNFNASSVGVQSYDYGYVGSAQTTTEDYDSVNGSAHAHLEEHPRFNPLAWAWKRRVGVVSGVRSGVSNAAKTGLQLSKNVGAVVAVAAAVTVGGLGLHHSGSGSMDDFSDSEDDSESSPRKFMG